MKRLSLIIFVLAVLIVSSNSAFALQRAEVDPNQFSLSYNVQFWEDSIEALNFEGDMGLTETIGIQSIFTYTDNNIYLDTNVKFRISSDNESDVSGIIGHHTDFSDSDFPRFGVLLTNSISRYLDLQAGVDFLRGHDHELGFFVGFDYLISRNLEFEIGYRQLSGQDQGGFIIGFRHQL